MIFLFVCFPFELQKARIQIWLFEQKDLRIEGRIIVSIFFFLLSNFIIVELVFLLLFLVLILYLGFEIEFIQVLRIFLGFEDARLLVNCVHMYCGLKLRLFRSIETLAL